MSQKLIKFITQNCSAGPAEKSLTSQLLDQKGELLQEIKQLDEAIEYLRNGSTEKMLTEFMEASDK